MDSKSISRLWMIKQLKFFRFLFHLAVLGSVLSFFLLSGLACLCCVIVAVLLSALSDFMRLNLDYPPG